MTNPRLRRHEVVGDGGGGPTVRCRHRSDEWSGAGAGGAVRSGSGRPRALVRTGGRSKAHESGAFHPPIH
jgi:hypothetical protein